MASDGLQLDWQEETERPGSAVDMLPFLVSMVVHLCLLIGLALAPVLLQQESILLTIAAPQRADEEELEFPEEFQISATPETEVGAHSDGGTQVAFSAGETLAELSQIPAPSSLAPLEISRVPADSVVEISSALQVDQLPVRGAVGEGTTGAAGAIDRITQDILLSLEERPTLVVWLFDCSASLLRQRREIHDRLNRVYQELGIIEASGNPAFKKHRDQPLLGSVVAFGSEVRFLTSRPTNDVEEIKTAIADVPLDETGIERVFTAVYMAAERYKSYRRRRPRRNVMMVVFTDEAGEDQNGVDRTVQLCRRHEMPVYVVGVPAPFGRRETMVKWVDPDPKYDQTPQQGVVDQGPESLLLERIRLAFFGGRDPGLIDSGFGPFALTRLCYETGGIYFAVHPNRHVERRVGWTETANYSAHLNHFFDPDVMRKYRPDYVSSVEYMRRIKDNRARAALVKAAELSWVNQMKAPRRRFVRRSEAALNEALSEAQKAAATVEPQLLGLFETLQFGAEDRPKETASRWQAGYDLAVGRVLAAKVRTEGYNAMLAKAKRGMEFRDAKNNTWLLVPADEIRASSRLAKDGERARELLERVAAEHAGTPWALLAARDLKTPLGWRWQERYTRLEPARREAPSAARRPTAGRDDRARPTRPPPPKRPPPKL